MEGIRRDCPILAWPSSLHPQVMHMVPPLDDIHRQNPELRSFHPIDRPTPTVEAGSADFWEVGRSSASKTPAFSRRFQDDDPGSIGDRSPEYQIQAESQGFRLDTRKLPYFQGHLNDPFKSLSPRVLRENRENFFRKSQFMHDPPRYRRTRKGRERSPLSSRDPGRTLVSGPGPPEERRAALRDGDSIPWGPEPDIS